MSQAPQAEITLMLNELRNGNKETINQLLPIVYKELRRLASKYLRMEYSNKTLQTTELVHEAYIKLVGGSNITPENRAHFFGIAANSMRQILVDYARKKKSRKKRRRFCKSYFM